MTEPYLGKIQSWLERIEPLDIRPTGAIATYIKETGIKAVVFDIYGTLIMSASGDVMQAEYSADMYKDACIAAGIEITTDDDEALIYMHDIYELMVKVHKERSRKKGIPFPEVDIEKVWTDVLADADQLGLIHLNDAFDLRAFIFVFELRSNKVWPMPGLKEALEGIRNKGYKMGIVSNAQFYTPVIMNYFLYNRIDGRPFLDQFEEKLSVFSYKLLKGKPDTAIYKALFPGMEELGILPHEVLYVGNDMLKDIWPANEVGFKTVFYAGDERAYRLREDHPQASMTRPDHIITALTQLLEII
ncbi:HAD family hydrolase [Saccharicrinis sp. FJH54]|uniref:HAD family hydrolase n=1 Tax=Saccharicrinis sp. FJH54 TaxID=3344665 RepID=UPI0035D46051